MNQNISTIVLKNVIIILIPFKISFYFIIFKLINYIFNIKKYIFYKWILFLCWILIINILLLFHRK